MNEISNRTLVFLITIAIFFSLFGTVTVLNKLGVDAVPLITGAQTATQQAQVNVTVAASTSIVLRNGANVTFGNGSAAGGVALSTLGGTDNPNTFFDPGSNSDADDFVVENDGNVDVNLTINGSSAADFITSGTSPAYNWSGTNFSSVETTDNGCIDGNLTTTQTPFGVEGNDSICQNFTFRDADDRLNVTINLFLPGDTEPSTYTDSNIFFMASQV